MHKLIHKLSTVVITATVLIIFPQSSFAAISSDQINQIARKVTVKIEDDNRSNGSGVIVAKLGSTYFVLTAEHVVKTEQGYTISTPNGKKYPAKYSSMVKLPNVDLAVVPFSSQESYAIAKVGNSNKVRKGNKTFIAGFPAVTRKYKFTNGDVVANASSKAVELGYTLIYSNPTDRGMSGGGVFNDNGEIVGIHGKADDTGSEKEQRVLTGYKAGIPVNTFLTILPNTKLALGFSVPTSSDNGATAIDDLIAKTAELERRGEFRELLAFTDKAIKDGVANDYIYVAHGTSLLILGDKKRALSAYNQAIKINPNYAGAYNNRGFIRSALGDNTGAIEDYNQSIKINPNYASAYNNRGFVRSALGDNTGAIEDYNQSIKINPNFPVAYSNRGLARYALSDKQGAIEDFNQALKIDPNYSKAYYNRGTTRSDLGDKQGAIEDFNQAIKINPNYVKAYNNRGTARSDLGDNIGAIEDHNQVLKINPNFAHAYTNRGVTRSNSGDKIGAIEDLNKAVELYDNQGNQAGKNSVLRLLRQIQN